MYNIWPNGLLFAVKCRFPIPLQYQKFSISLKIPLVIFEKSRPGKVKITVFCLEFLDTRCTFIESPNLVLFSPSNRFRKYQTEMKWRLSKVGWFFMGHPVHPLWPMQD